MTNLKVDAGLPFKWNWLLSGVTTLVGYTARFTASSSPVGSPFSNTYATLVSTDTDPQVTKTDPNRVDLSLVPATTASLKTGYYQVVLRNADPRLDILVAQGRLLVARKGTV